MKLSRVGRAVVGSLVSIGVVGIVMAGQAHADMPIAGGGAGATTMEAPATSPSGDVAGDTKWG